MWGIGIAAALVWNLAPSKCKWEQDRDRERENLSFISNFKAWPRNVSVTMSPEQSRHQRNKVCDAPDHLCCAFRWTLLIAFKLTCYKYRITNKITEKQNTTQQKSYFHFLIFLFFCQFFLFILLLLSPVFLFYFLSNISLSFFNICLKCIIFLSIFFFFPFFSLSFLSSSFYFCIVPFLFFILLPMLYSR